MANDINVVALSGRLTRDAELKYANSGTAICRIGMASNWSKKQGDTWNEEVSYFDMVMFGRRAEALQKHLTKGTQIFVKCQARQDRWEKDGNTRSKVNFIIDDLQFGSGGGNGGKGGNGGGQRGGASQGNSQSAGDIFDQGGDGDFQDDVPF